MNTKMILASAVIVGLAVGCANLPRSRDTANPDVPGETLALQVCSNCHGPTGNSVSPNFPNLAQQQDAYIVAQLNQFRRHSRVDPAGFEYMWGLSHNLSDKQIQELAAHFAGQSLDRLPAPANVAADRLAAGKAIFTAGIADSGIPPCASCHGANGMGAASFPRIAGQHADYLVKQLGVFQRTDQRPDGAIMKTVAHKLTQQNIEDVSAYLQSMRVD